MTVPSLQYAADLCATFDYVHKCKITTHIFRVCYYFWLGLVSGISVAYCTEIYADLLFIIYELCGT